MKENQLKVIDGHTAKVLRESKITGRSTVLGSNSLLNNIKEFQRDVFGKFNEKTIDSFKKIPDGFTFRTGHGYDVVDKDLLGGSGDGLTKEVFKNYVAYKENSIDTNLKKLNESIKKYNGDNVRKPMKEVKKEKKMGFER